MARAWGWDLAISPRPFRFTTLVRYRFELTKLFVQRIKVLVETENPASSTCHDQFCLRK